MTDTLKKYNMKSPVTGNDLTDPLEFNLMFATSIGPTGQIKGQVKDDLRNRNMVSQFQFFFQIDDTLLVLIIVNFAASLYKENGFCQFIFYFFVSNAIDKESTISLKT